MRWTLIAILALTTVVAPPALADPPDRLLEPSLHLQASTDSAAPRVALTLDACGGSTDLRILDALVENRVAATIFVTGVWLKRNPEAFATMRAHPDLFEIGDHGARHVPAVDRPVHVYGLKAAGSPAAVKAEVELGSVAIIKNGGSKPRWFRGATAKYSTGAIRIIHDLGYEVAGYSLNGDGGSLLGQKTTTARIAGAKDGDVILAHINQPRHAAGSGVVAGVLALKARGFTFVRLSDVKPQGLPSGT
ncbi:polysaccharide deacetylase family protein [Mesorhizobium sp. NBSH29]|nr:polysaccharide deacetylase family protein [Mesorhizobium sp. NBSH29]